MISQIRWGFAGALVLSELALWLASDVWYHVPQDEIVEIAIFALLALIAVFAALYYTRNQFTYFNSRFLGASLLLLVVGVIFQRGDREVQLCNRRDFSALTRTASSRAMQSGTWQLPLRPGWSTSLPSRSKKLSESRLLGT